MQTAKELFVSIKQLSALIVRYYHLKAAQLICHCTNECLYAFVWLSIFSYLQVLSQTFILFVSFVIELQNTFCRRLERLALVQKQKMVKCGSACSVIKHGCKDIGLRFHSPATKNLLINPKQSKK